MRINNNISALNTYRQYTNNSNSVNKSMEKLSSGLRINRAGDDAAGLAISEKMRAQIRGTDMAAKNSQDAISLVQTAEGALNETHSILQRMNELAVQSASDTNEDTDRSALNTEFQQLSKEIDDIATQTKFNGKSLLNGTFSDAVTKATAAGLADGVSVRADSTATVATNTAITFANNVSAVPGDVTDNLAVDSASAGDAAMTMTAGGSATNGTYSLKIEGSGSDLTSGLTITLVGPDGAEHAATETSLTAGSANTLTFAGLGSLSLTINAAGAGGTLTDVQNDFDGTENSKYTFDVANAEDAGATINGQAVEEGDTSVELAPGVTMSFDALSAEDMTDVNSLKAAILADPAGSATFSVSLTPAKTPLTIQTGSSQGETLDIHIGAMDSDTLGLGTVTIDTKVNAQAAIKSVSDAIDTVSSQRANLGAMQNRLDHKINNLNTTSENLTAAESRIRDVDMAQEMVEFTKNNILVQASQAMLAQANAQPQGVLQLLQ